MRFGIGGSIGPLRLGVSTRGIGGGIGPFSAGTSWRRRGKSDGTVPAIFWGAILAFLVIAWPYLLGAWAAVQLGAPSPSAARSVAGWTLEVLYLVGLVWLGGRALLGAERARSEQERAERLAAAQAAAASSEELAGLLRRRPFGEASPALPASHRLLMRFDNANLVELRSERRGGPKVPTEVALGHVLVTDHGVTFVGPDRTVTWRFDKLFDINSGADWVTLAVTTRQRVNGVAVGSARLPALLRALHWGSTVAEGADLAAVAAAAYQLARDDAATLDALTPQATGQLEA